MSDILLTDEDVVVIGRLVGKEKEITSDGSEAGFAFKDRDVQDQDPGTKPGDRWVWYSKGGKARLYTDGPGDRLTISPEGRLGIGTDSPVSPLEVKGSSEITSTGSGAGFAFADRDPKIGGGGSGMPMAVKRISMQTATATS